VIARPKIDAFGTDFRKGELVARDKDLKRDKERLERDARYARSHMDLDEAAQEVMDDEAASAKERWRDSDDDDFGRSR
jgi:hypothetical protein